MIHKTMLLTTISTKKIRVTKLELPTLGTEEQKFTTFVDTGGLTTSIREAKNSGSRR